MVGFSIFLSVWTKNQTDRIKVLGHKKHQVCWLNSERLVNVSICNTPLGFWISVV